MNSFNWENRIREWSQKRIEALTERKKVELPPEVLESRYLGFPGATEEQISDAETYLGVTFPPSYREFLKVSNGLRSTSEYGIQFYSTEEVEWYILGNGDVIDSWIETWKENPVTDEEYFIYGKEQNDLVFRPEYCKTALEISSEDMGFIFLLNPQVVTSNGEWEAWFCSFSTLWGVSRYRSFAEMMDEVFNHPESFIT